MADTAAHLVDRVLPEAAVRQWVLTLPYPLRYRCAWNAELTREVLRCFPRAVFADYRRRAKRDLGVRGGACGSVTFIQRFGSALNLTPHFHTIVLDGVYDGGASSPGRFRALDPPETDDVARVLAGTARRIRRRLEFLGEEDGEPDGDRLAEDEPLLAMLSAASVRSRIATGPEAGSPWRRLGDRVDAIADREEEDGVEPGARIPLRCVRQGAMRLHADVAVPARDRQRLERLCRSVARPPLALERLEELRDGRLAYRLKTPWRDGTTHVVMERRELLERLAPLVPPPRSHQVRYHGVLALCASGWARVVPAHVELSREQVAPAGGPTADVGGVGSTPGRTNGSIDSSSVGRLAVFGIESRNEPSAAKASGAFRSDSPVATEAQRIEIDVPPFQTSAPVPADSRRDSRRAAWADLLQRVFEVDALRCPNCGARMRVLSAITDPDVARRILDCLQISPRAPPLVPAENRVGADLEEGSADLDWGGGPGFDFDQSDPAAE